MKRLLATTAVATMAFAGAASAQSVLERVLGQIDNATNLASVNGTYANIAENIGGAGTTTVYVDIANDVVISADDYEAGLQSEIDLEVQADLATFASGPGNTVVLDEPDSADYDLTTVAGQTAYNDAVADFTATQAVIDGAQVAATNNYTALYQQDVVAVAGLEGINGSINNTLDGIDGATQEAIASIDVSAIEWDMPTVNLGDMATTALGAVNTGDITLGVNSAVDEAKTSTTNAISAVVDQLGGSADTGAIVLNVASNMTGVNGSINNVMDQVNGSIGDLSTTALGAVNTGTIVSGVDAAVAGIVGSTSGGTTVATE